MNTCDDCGKQYDGEPYYTFEAEGCTTTIGDVVIPHECTGNICPSCAGPYIEPDHEDDPRRPTMPDYQPSLGI